jgi:hypothetical protein
MILLRRDDGELLISGYGGGKPHFLPSFARH